MTDLKNQRILLGISGGIAAYKAGFLVRELKRLGAEVKVVMTESAQKFVTPLTFQALSGESVYTSLWEEATGHGMDHISLARWADVLVVAPATANCMAKMAHGLADDLLSTLYLVTEAPVLLCPAMNQSMWKATATVQNVQTLKSRGVHIIGPEDGEAACGETGLGRLCDIQHIIHALYLYPIAGCLSGKAVMITAGPTRERIDPVRYVSNDSSGKMGYALAEAAVIAGATVTLVSGPTTLTAPLGAHLISVESAAEMHEAVMTHLKPQSIFIGAAAVADYRPAIQAQQKMKKNGSVFALDWVQNEDIVATVAASKRATYVVGFAAETEHVLPHARRKLLEKHLDMIIANQVGKGIGFNQDEQAVTILTRDSEMLLPTQHKLSLAGEMVRIIANEMNA